MGDVVMSNSSVNLARMLATTFHDGQKYGALPYTAHLEAVVDLITTVYGAEDERLLIVAWLHDTVEDTALQSGTILNIFGNDVSEAVWAMTRKDGETNEAYIQRVKKNPIARKVKGADAYCNMTESLTRLDMKRVAKYAGYIHELAKET